MYIRRIIVNTIINIHSLRGVPFLVVAWVQLTVRSEVDGAEPSLKSLIRSAEVLVL